MQFQFIDPSHWSDRYPDCGSYEQSPIDLQTSGAKAVSNNSVAAFSFANAYSSPVYGKWANNDHTGSSIDTVFPNEPD